MEEIVSDILKGGVEDKYILLHFRTSWPGDGADKQGSANLEDDLQNWICRTRRC